MPNTTSLRQLSLLYLLYFSSLGATLPYLPLVFEARGLTATEISWLMTLLPLSNIFVPPVWGIIADRLSSRSKLLRACLLGYGVAVVGLALSWGFAATLVVMIGIGVFRSPVTSLTDAITHAKLEGALHLFGRIRLWGSVGFFLGSICFGFIYDLVSQEIALGATALLVLSSGILIPSIDAPVDNIKESFASILNAAMSFFRHPTAILLLLSVFFYYNAHSTFDAYFGLHARALGISDTWIGLCWGVGVGTEVVLMHYAPRFIPHTNPLALLVGCGVISLLRWSLLAHLENDIAIILTQPLHAITFGLYYLCLTHWVQARISPKIRATIQSITLGVMSLGMISGYLWGGRLFEQTDGMTLFATSAKVAAVASLLFMLTWFSERRTKTLI
ncbi:MAG: MFS transporter [Myxococcota bacterium]|nr:MFS transporter [Myxococcota bacterium]